MERFPVASEVSVIRRRWAEKTKEAVGISYPLSPKRRGSIRPAINYFQAVLPNDNDIWAAPEEQMWLDCA